MAGGTGPGPTPETEPFWAGTLAGELRVQRCNSCGRHYFYPRPFCRYCQSADVAWQVVSGAGRLISYVINYRPLPPADPAEPQVIAQVELAPRGDQVLPVFRLTGTVAPMTGKAPR